MFELDDGKGVVVLIVGVVGVVGVVRVVEVVPVVVSTSTSFDSVAFVGSFNSKHFKYQNICPLRSLR